MTTYPVNSKTQLAYQTSSFYSAADLQQQSAEANSVQPILPVENIQPNFLQYNDTAQQSEADRKDKIQQAVQNLNRMAQQSSYSVQLEYNKEADRVVMRFIDPSNKEVVKQIPTESVLDSDVQIRKFVGILFDKFF